MPEPAAAMISEISNIIEPSEATLGSLPSHLLIHSMASVSWVISWFFQPVALGLGTGLFDLLLSFHLDAGQVLLGFQRVLLGGLLGLDGGVEFLAELKAGDVEYLDVEAIGADFFGQRLAHQVAYLLAFGDELLGSELGGDAFYAFLNGGIDEHIFKIRADVLIMLAELARPMR